MVTITLQQSIGSSHTVRSSSPISTASCQKQPVTPDMLEAMVIACGANPRVSDVHFLAACLMGFAAFLRYDELSSLKCSDILLFVGS